MRAVRSLLRSLMCVVSTANGLLYLLISSSRIVPEPKHDTYSASAQFRYAVFDQAGLFAEYYYFVSSFQSAVPGEFPRGDFGRHGVRAGLSFGTELLGGRR